MFYEKNSELNKNQTSSPSSPSVSKRVYTVEEIIEILGVSKTTAYNLVNSGSFHCVKVGGHYRISKKSFDKWLDDIDETNNDCQVYE